jgi:hypothetical protein
MKYQPSVSRIESDLAPYDEAYEETEALALAAKQSGEAATIPSKTMDEGTLADRLLWKTTQIQVDAGPYRSTVLSHKHPTVLGKLVGFIHNNRKSFAALGMAASVGMVAKNAVELTKVMDPITLGNSNISSQTQDPSTQMLVPYTVIAGVKVQVSASDCLNGVVNDCQVNVGSGPRKINPAPPSKQAVINSQVLNHKRY